jgi:hypothetical protein
MVLDCGQDTRKATAQIVPRLTPQLPLLLLL